MKKLTKKELALISGGWFMQSLGYLFLVSGTYDAAKDFYKGYKRDYNEG